MVQLETENRYRLRNEGLFAQISHRHDTENDSPRKQI